jgi:formamidopyrimidine-DNA glycosylase
MPELPEVETVCRYLQLQLPGSTVTATVLRRPDLRYPMPQAAIAALPGRQLLGLQRRAKYILLATSARQPMATEQDAPQTVLVHLGMTGRLFVHQDPQGAEPEWRLHEHWRFALQGPNGQPLWLRYVDARRFGALDVLDTATQSSHPLLASLGPEPLGPAFDAGYLLSHCQGKRAAVKLVLMDGHVVVGVGNIYANEACFRAHIAPQCPAGQLTLADCQRLVAAVVDVLQEAIAAGGSTLKDFASGDESPGYFQQRLDVYDRAGQACHRCGGVIVRSVLGQRATFACSGCQASK